ncbi:MAG: hypothetical protein V8Q82_01690 [Christensenellales bacterium]
MSDEHKLLTALRDTAITDDDMAEVFFQRVLAGTAAGGQLFRSCWRTMLTTCLPQS